MTTRPTAIIDLLDGPALPNHGHRTLTPSLLSEMRREFLARPGLRLTLIEAARLWHLDALTCDVALRVLVEERVLVRTRYGAFRRAEG